MTMSTSMALHAKPFFSDQSHLLFYGCSSSAQCKPVKTRLRAELTSASQLTSCCDSKRLPLHSAPDPSTATSPAVNYTCAELDPLKELAVLKAQVKLKKKQLKAIAKEKKISLKKKKAKSKGKSSSSSSSSSESSDGGRIACSMKLLKVKSLRQTREEIALEQDMVLRGDSHGLDHLDIPEDRDEDIAQCLQGEPRRSSSSVERACLSRPFDQDAALAEPPQGAFGAAHAHGVSGSVEVCVGGKCKKAGSHQLLSAFRAQIPASACVDTTPCKCMGRCGTAMNVKVHKEDTNPQHHSHVSVDDVGFILGHHFGLGPPSSRVPSFPCLSPASPSVITAQL